MLSLIGNIDAFEVLVIAALAVIIFGRRLPEVAGKAYAQFRKFREALERLRRESGIDREMREIERSVREAEWRKTLARDAPPVERSTPAQASEASVPRPSTTPSADVDEEALATSGVDAHRGEANDVAADPEESAKAPEARSSFDDRREA